MRKQDKSGGVTEVFVTLFVGAVVGSALVLTAVNVTINSVCEERCGESGAIMYDATLTSGCICVEEKDLKRPGESRRGL